MKKILFAVSLLTSLSSDSFSQVVNIYKISPQHLVANTFSVSWERASSPFAKTSLNISPFVTYYDKKISANVSEKLAGAGLELGRKLYVSIDSTSPLAGFYASGSIIYGYYHADYQKSDDSNAYVNSYGYPYLTKISSGRFYNETIHKFGADIGVGYQILFKKLFYIDLFLGAGMRYGISSQGSNSIYNADFLGIAHSGIIPKAGIKLGLRF